MDTGSTVVEALTLVGCVLFFDIWERLRPGHPVDRGRYLRLDLLAMAVVIVVGTLWKQVLLQGFETAGAREWFSGLEALHALPSAAKIALGLLAADLALYLVHLAMHASDLLWKTHVFHHSIEELYWLSGARTSVTHLFLFALPQVILAYFLFGLTAGEATVAFSLGVVVNLWVHTNLSVRLGPLEWLLITPDYHRVHHGTFPGPSRNLGFILTVWDRVFGTYADPRKLPRDYRLGLADASPGTARMIVGY